MLKEQLQESENQIDNEVNPPEEKKKHPRSDEIENNLHRAYNLLDEGDFNQAARAFGSVILMDHDNYKAMTGYGKCLAELGMYEAACEYFEKALEISPDYTEAQLNYAIYKDVKNIWKWRGDGS